ncbi:MAG: hypothetical protein IJZ35_03250 [Clostridia bacterium]|nr:hypothetical protein [Clostridia bacterium]
MAYNPLIIIPGPAISLLDIVDENGNKIKKAWPVDIDKQAVLNLLKSSMMKMMLLRKDCGFSYSVAKIAADAVEPLSVNPDGTKKHNVKAYEIKPSYKNCSEGFRNLINKAFSAEKIADAIGEDNIFCFSYDMFGDIYTVADELDKFIGTVKKSAASEKVDLLCVSLGGTVLKAYLDAHSQKNDVEKVISVASLMNGSSLIADAFEGKLSLNDTGALLALLGEKGATLSSLMGMLPPDAIENTVTKCMAIIKNSLLNSCTMMWACIPNDRFDAVYAAIMPKGSELDKKVTKLYNYSLNLSSELKALEAQGMKFCQLCGYGKNLIPLTENNAVCSDGVVDTSLASFGAVCTSVDATPDNSGCLFGDTTWFIRDAEHLSINHSSKAADIVAAILTDSADMSKYQ